MIIIKSHWVLLTLSWQTDKTIFKRIELDFMLNVSKESVFFVSERGESKKIFFFVP